MPVIRDDEGAIVVIPDGDILFCNTVGPDGRQEILLCEPGGKMEIGSLHPEGLGRTSAELKAMVRIVLPTIAHAVILLERVTVASVSLCGLAPGEAAGEELRRLREENDRLRQEVTTNG